MKTPKLLPWHAARKGISEARAEALWRRAIEDATERIGWVGNAEYWAEAMARFVELLDEESVHAYVPDITSLLRSYNRILRLPLTAMEDLCIASSTRRPEPRTQDPARHPAENACTP